MLVGRKSGAVVVAVTRTKLSIGAGEGRKWGQIGPNRVETGTGGGDDAERGHERLDDRKRAEAAASEQGAWGKPDEPVTLSNPDPFCLKGFDDVHGKIEITKD